MLFYKIILITSSIWNTAKLHQKNRKINIDSTIRLAKYKMIIITSAGRFEEMGTLIQICQEVYSFKGQFLNNI